MGKLLTSKNYTHVCTIQNTVKFIQQNAKDVMKFKKINFS